MTNVFSKNSESPPQKAIPKDIDAAGIQIDKQIAKLQQNLGPFSEVLLAAVNNNESRKQIAALVKEQLALQHQHLIYDMSLGFTEAKLQRFNEHMKSNQTLQEDLFEASAALVNTLVDIKNGAVADSYRQAKRHTDDLQELHEEGAMTTEELKEEVNDIKNMRSILLEDVKEKLRLICEQHAHLILETVRLFKADPQNV